MQKLAKAPLVALTAMVGGLLGLVACSAGSGLDYATYTTTGTGAGAMAQLTGEIRDEGGCLTIVDEEGMTHVPIFASNDPRPQALQDGEHVEFGGGYSDTFTQEHDVPDSCSALLHPIFTVSEEF
ncbi:hypothetical protein [uncultured Agrococcus sp.]|uniref:hypothetical protein n=1 Tax=uncultured Agrococcus sp. TaxID=382258 RepID=UPI0025E731F2|nr:hypothetical protein [uncultured Agrococcus sp.]